MRAELGPAELEPAELEPAPHPAMKVHAINNAAPRVVLTANNAFILFQLGFEVQK